MLGCMTSFTLERWIPRTFVAITRNNDVVWSISWTLPSLTSLMIFCIMSPIWANVFSMGVDELEGWLWFYLFFHIGGGIIQSHNLTHINNPWFFKMIFIDLFIIRFIVINVQIGKVNKHGNKTSTIRSILCPTILNDIFFNEISTCKKNGNLMFIEISTQCPFTYAISILGERKWDLICHIRMLFDSYHPCMAIFVRIIYPMGGIGVRDQCGLLNVCFYNAFHNLIFNEPMFFHFNNVHVVVCNYCLESPH